MQVSGIKELQARSRAKVSLLKTLRKFRHGGGVPPGAASTSCLCLDQHLAVTPLDVLVEDHLKLLDDPVALQRGEKLPVDIHRRLGLLKRSRQRDANIGMLRLARPVHHTAHHRQLQLLDARINASSTPASTPPGSSGSSPPAPESKSK